MRLDQIEAIETQIINHLCLDSESLMWFNVDSGNDFLEEYFEETDPLLNKIKRTQSFWHFWRTRWANRDKYLMESTKVRQNGIVYIMPITDTDEYGLEHQKIYTWDKVYDFYKSFHELNIHPGEISPPVEIMELANQLY